MNYTRVYSDKRYGIDKSNASSQYPYRCIYCGELATEGQGDHIPAGCFLNKPYPEGEETVVTVPACVKCNNETSLDEEYVAFVIKYAKYGDNSKEVLSFKHYHSLRPRLCFQCGIDQDEILLESERFDRVIIKYGYALARYECSAFIHDQPKIIAYGFVDEMTFEQCDSFNEIKHFEDVLPEIGARMSQLIIVNADYKMGHAVNDWKVIQEDVFRYVVFFNDDDDIVVRMVFEEVFYAEIIF
jgi:hypothetical protein